MINAHYAVDVCDAEATPATRATIKVQGARGYVEQCMVCNHILLGSFAQNPSVFSPDDGERDYATLDRFNVLPQVR